MGTSQASTPKNKSVKNFAKSSLRKLLKKRKFKLVKNESRSLVFDKEEHTYSQKLMLKTARGYICQGGLSFEVSLDRQVEEDTLWTSLSCYKVKKETRNKRKS